MLAPHSARRVETRRAEWARRSWSAHLRRSSDSVAAATPSQQRLRRSSAARSISSVAAASAASRTRRAEWARRSWSAHLRRSSDSVAAPSQQRCAHHERSTGQSKIIEQPVGKICHLLGKNRGTPPPSNLV